MRIATVVLMVIGAVCFGQAGWIHVKALAAQVLLERAWGLALVGAPPPRPWPWADTHPVARLEVPRLDVNQIVLEGDSGAMLAFGPGHAPESSLPGRPGTAIISGHRDTHFRFLNEMRLGDHLFVTDTAAARTRYEVIETRIIDVRTDRLMVSEEGLFDLVLVTCWPFDAVTSGGPLRYVVVATRRDEQPQRTALGTAADTRRRGFATAGVCVTEAC